MGFAKCMEDDHDFWIENTREMKNLRGVSCNGIYLGSSVRLEETGKGVSAGTTAKSCLWDGTFAKIKAS